MNPSSQYPHRRRLTRAEARRRRRNRAIRRVAGLTLVACVLVGGVSFLLHRKAPVPAASAASALPAASSTAASEAAPNGLFGKNEAASSAVSSEPAARTLVKFLPLVMLTVMSFSRLFSPTIIPS